MAGKQTSKAAPAGTRGRSGERGHAPRAGRRRCGLPWVLVGLLLLVTAHARADSPIAIKAGATTPQPELTSPGMTLGGSLSGPRWRPLSGLVLTPLGKTLLHELHRLSTSTSSNGVSATLAAQETAAAASFADRAIGALGL